jgi:hypothetical protein
MGPARRSIHHIIVHIATTYPLQDTYQGIHVRLNYPCPAGKSMNIRISSQVGTPHRTGRATVSRRSRHPQHRPIETRGQPWTYSIEYVGGHEVYCPTEDPRADIAVT